MEKIFGIIILLLICVAFQAVYIRVSDIESEMEDLLGKKKKEKENEKREKVDN